MISTTAIPNDIPRNNKSSPHNATTINPEHTDAQKIQAALIESFSQICSAGQMELCQRLGMLSKNEQQQAFKMAKALIENRQMPVTLEDWNGLTEWVLLLRDRYTMQIELQAIRQCESDAERMTYMEEVQRLSHCLEDYGQAHEDLTDLIQALKKLRNEWKHRNKDVENIVLSILSSSQLKNRNYRVVKVTRSQLSTLGLGLSSIGKYYIVYESTMSDEAKKQVLNCIANDFSMVFQENAAQNLARMADTHHHIFKKEEEVDVLEEIQRLTHKVYITRPKSVVLPYPTILPTASTSFAGQNSVDTNTPLNKRNSTFLERRKSIIIIDEDGDEKKNDAFGNNNSANPLKTPMVFNMANPIFEPAGWDWPHFLKYKISRTRSNNNSSQPNSSAYWCRQNSANAISASIDSETTNAAPSGVWCTSISRLAVHFGKVGQDYYSNMLNNARLMHSHRAQMFEFASHSLMKTYRALQLEHGCANLSRTLVFLYRLQQESARV
ncbi:hypothetical protein BDF20DRAFT_879667 [Mycotypha africana]|uniref:uncharacterized protein n=1 Tax=Mycotypha africana TaxID=64632 RepID=UPI0022FFE193|nr:uncharacterized protein BDF20DRAFT_879667 [Mycotypha africana]KAI8975617.1 hypothetical protein BDF20DRAFT_879667 [Mycotypha africana]